ncbi:hypothetical protein SDC9_166076 [bioreactor metagenome]|uniref:Uncharacterized protein n=1 Tax=bioreactor metagenome TaxID=1076179 RepID=A0A645G3W4_9ZZZZ
MRANVGIGIMDKDAWLRIAIGINMKIISPPGNTTANILSVVLKIHGKNSLSMAHISNLPHTVIHKLPLFRARQ